jgi:hypothetical protein
MYGGVVFQPSFGVCDETRPTKDSIHKDELNSLTLVNP